MHAIEGVLASLLVLLYLGNIVVAPTQTDWERTALTKRSSDIMGMLSRTGDLDDYIVEDDPESLDALLSVMGTSVGYTMFLQGIPERDIETLVLMNSSEVIRSGTTATAPTAVSSAPDSEFGYRTGTINGVDFVLSDSGNNNGVLKHNFVSFDFDGDGEYNSSAFEYVEGPYQTTMDVEWCPGGTCTGQRYQIGYMNDTLTLYNLTGREWLWDEFSSFAVQDINVTNDLQAEELLPPISLDASEFSQVDGDWQATWSSGGITVQFRLGDQNRSVLIDESGGFTGPYRSGDTPTILGQTYTVQGDPTSGLVPLELSPSTNIDGDILFASHVDPELLDDHRSAIQSFLNGQNTVFEVLDFSGYSPEEFERSIHGQIGLEMVELPLDRRGSSRNVFPEDRTPGSAAGFIEDYFYDMPITVPTERMNFTPDQPSRAYATGNISLAGTEYTFNISFSDGPAEFSISEGGTFSDWYEPEEEFRLDGNLYYASDLVPFTLETTPSYRFGNLYSANITAEQPILAVEGWDWDPAPLSINVTGFTTVPRPPGTYDPQGGTEVCSDAYRRATFTGPDGEDYNATLSNREPCDIFFEFVNFDFNRDGTYADDMEGTGAFSGEGPYQFDDEVTIANTTYIIDVGSQGEWLYLERKVPEVVPTAVWEPNAYRGNGNVFYMGEQRFSDDTLQLMKAVLFRSAVERHRFTVPKVQGSPTVGVTVSDSVNQGVFMPYTVESRWWFR